MDKDTYKNNLKALKEIILDEQKLVTYVSLSKELCIHVNDAKSLMNDVVKDIRKTEPKTDIYVCYVISGLLNNNSACTRVCAETEIEDLRKSLSIIFYEHVYCVSRGMQNVDNVALTAINKFEDFPLCTGLIKANSCLKRADDEILKLKSTNHAITIESKPSNAITKNSTEKKKEVVKNGHDTVKKPVEVKTEPVIKSKTPSPKKDSTANDKGNIKKNVTKPAAKGIAGFFNKANGDTKKATTNNKVKEEKKTEVPIKVEPEIKVKTEPAKTVTPVKTEKEVSVKKSKENSSEKKSNSNSLKQIKKNAKVDKKRKRVLHVSDSESETETNDADPFADEENKMAVDHDSEDEIPPTPTTNTVKITSGIVNPKKRRKIVDKTYTDEDGYILTKKEEVYESCSDNEEEAKVTVKQEKENVAQLTQVKTETSPKENGKSKKRKISPPQKGKQQMLTNFFKKV